MRLLSLWEALIVLRLIWIDVRRYPSVPHENGFR
jgi:hypothetical protein